MVSEVFLHCVSTLRLEFVVGNFNCPFFNIQDSSDLASGRNIFEGKNRTATFAHRICENTEEDVTFLNLNPYFCGFRSGAASSHPLRNLSRSHFHNQCHPFILRYDSHPHHPTHQRVIVSRYFTKFLPFFPSENCWGRILSTPVVVLLFILELPSSFFPIKS